MAAGTPIPASPAAASMRSTFFPPAINAAAHWAALCCPRSGSPPPAQISPGNVSARASSGWLISSPSRVSSIARQLLACHSSGFAEWTGNQRDFRGGAFDSQGCRVVGGLLLEPGPGARVKGEVYAGYMNQNYTGIGFQTVSTYTYGGALAWLIAPRWTAVA